MTLGIIDFFKNYVGFNPETNEYPLEGIIKFSIDAILTLIIIGFIVAFLIKHTKDKKVLVWTLVYLIGLIVVSLIGLKITRILLAIGVLIFIWILIVNYAPEVKSHYSGLKRIKGEKGFITSETVKEEFIDELLKAVDYLTSRQIGAIITIEKENSLNTYIEKGTKIDSVVTAELLETIFFPNTALHDGAVIIRGNRIMSAGSFFPSSANSDIPKHYGSRHRAGLGISEVTDAFTIIVSEETGNIATTIAGTITGEQSMDSLRVSLNQNIIVK